MSVSPTASGSGHHLDLKYAATPSARTSTGQAVHSAGVATSPQPTLLASASTTPLPPTAASGTSASATPSAAAAPSAAPSMVENTNIVVGVRVRPFDANELKRGERSAWEIDPAQNQIRQRYSLATSKNSELLTFAVNHLFPEHISTEELYQTVGAQIVGKAMKGINGTIFAYGQTSSGKTYTMKGTDKDMGVIALAMNDIFRHIEKMTDREFLLRVSYLEIYNETERDLLNPGGDEKVLEIRESKERGVFIDKLTEQIVTSVAGVLQCISNGEQHRHYGKTNMNDFSSRSHTIFRLTIESKKIGASSVMNHSGRMVAPRVRVSTLNFVDLAGSERMAQTGTVAGSIRQREGKFINKSLLVLGIVISRLSEGAQQYIPFRDSKLTRILQSSLGGNSLTAIICNVSPALTNVEHTLNTLRFGQRAIRIRNHAQVNEVAGDKAMIFQNEAQIVEHNKPESKLALAAAKEKKDMEMKLAALTELFLSNMKQSADSAGGADGGDRPVSRRRRASLSTVDDQKTLVARGLTSVHNLKAATAAGAGNTQEDFQKEQMRAKIIQYDKLLSDFSGESDALIEQAAARENDMAVMTAKLAEQQTEIETLRRDAKVNGERLTVATTRLALIEDGKGLDEMEEKELNELHVKVTTSANRINKFCVWYDLKRNPLMFQPARLAAIQKADADRFTALAQEKAAVTQQLEVAAATAATLKDQHTSLVGEHEAAKQAMAELKNQLARTVEENQLKADEIKREETARIAYASELETTKAELAALKQTYADAEQKMRGLQFEAAQSGKAALIQLESVAAAAAATASVPTVITVAAPTSVAASASSSSASSASSAASSFAMPSPRSTSRPKSTGVPAATAVAAAPLAVSSGAKPKAAATPSKPAASKAAAAKQTPRGGKKPATNENVNTLNKRPSVTAAASATPVKPAGPAVPAAADSLQAMFDQFAAAAK